MKDKRKNKRVNNEIELMFAEIMGGIIGQNIIGNLTDKGAEGLREHMRELEKRTRDKILRMRL